MLKKVADRLFRWYCHPDYYPDIQGDLEELYQEHLEDTPNQATRKYLGDVLLLMRPALMRPFFGSQTLANMTMLSNHFKVAVRVSRHNKSFTAINVLGLALGMALTLMIIQYVRFELSYEDMYSKSDRLVRPTMDYLNGGTLVDQDCETYPPLGARMVSDMPEVVNYARAYNLEEISVVRVGDAHHFAGKIYAADSSFFDLFDHQFVHGTRKGLFEKPHEVVLTETRAKTYFGRTDVVGEVIEFPGSQDYVPLKIVGVINDLPFNTHLKFDMLLSYATMHEFGEEKDEENWNGNNTFTYVELGPNVKYKDFEAKMIGFNAKLTEEEKLRSERVAVQPVRDIHLYSHKSFEAEANGDANSVYLLLVVAILVILIAYVNYVNLSTSKALDRAREVGIRKVVGSSVGQLKGQFLVESIFVNLLAAVVAVGIMVIAQPHFIGLAGLPTDFALLGDPKIWLMLSGFVFVGAILSGLYPAFVLSRFRVAMVLRGTYAKSTQGAMLRRVLVILQFTITIVLLSQTLAVNQQLSFMRNKDLGVDVSKTIVMEMPSIPDRNGSYKAFQNKLMANAYVEYVTTSETVPGLPGGEMGTTTGVNPVDALEEHNFNFYLSFVDSAYIPTMGIEVIAGENYDGSTAPADALIANEEAIRLWGYSSPEEALGQKIDLWGEQPRVRAVVRNFHQESAKSAHIPMIILLGKQQKRFVSVRVTNDDMSQRLAEVRAIYEDVYPSRPFSYFFLDQRYDQQFRTDERFQQVFAILTLFAIVIACLGLFGLASFVVSKRTKEIGIRKVLGASSRQIVALLSTDFIKTVMVSIIIAVPGAYYLISAWLEGFAFRMDMTAWLFVIPAVMVVVLAMISLSAKTVKTSLSNPVESLRDE